MKIKNYLKKYRKLANFKQGESADYLNMTIRQYQRLENQTPKSVIQFYKLAKFYGTTIDDLLQQDNDNEELFRPPRKNSSSQKQ